MKLYELAKLIRAKNAGPFMLTIDVLFETEEAYNTVVNSCILKPEPLSKLYDMPATDVEYYELPLAKAIKISFPRKMPSGDITDVDVYGGQFHQPLVELDVL